MADFRIRFVSDLIASLTATATADAPTDFVSIEDLSRAFLIPAVFPMCTAGIGRESGSLVNALANLTATATITDTDQITFDDGDTAQGRSNRVGAWLVEYIGPNGGPNEIIVRGVRTVTLPTTTTADSSAITGISTLADCVPFVFARCSHNSAEYRSHIPDVDLVTSGSDVVARVTRVSSSGTMTAIVQAVEFTGANWTVQKVNHTFVASATNEDETISDIGAVTNAFTYSVMAATAANVPASNTYYVYPTSTTNLRHRIINKPSTSPTVRTWVISNPMLSVTRYGTPDGTPDITASGVSPETQNVPVVGVTDLGQAMVLAYVGSNSTATSSVPALFWLSDLSTASNWRIRRSTSVGDTEYVAQVIDFVDVISSEITEVSEITNGSTFTITGTFGATPTVTLGGVNQPVDSSDSEEIVCDGTLGALLYGVLYELRVTDAQGGLATTLASIGPAAGTSYANLASPILAAPSRATSISLDLASGDQLELSNVQGGDETDITISSNGLMRVQEDVTAFDLRANDGTGWGALGTQTWEDAVIPTSNPPEFNGTISNLILHVGEAITAQDYASHFSDDGDLAYSSSALPTGLTLSAACVLSGTPTVPGLYTPITISATDDDDQTISSNPFMIVVQSTADDEPEFVGPDFAEVFAPIAQAYSLDVSPRFSHPTDPLTYSLTAGTLPFGLTLSGSFITGTATTSQKVTGLQITATDLNGDTAVSDEFSIEIYIPSRIHLQPLSGGIRIQPL